MHRLIHNILCNVSRRYRVTHCDSVDDLPPRFSRRLRESCREMDPVSYSSAAEMWEAMQREWEEEDRAQEMKSSGFGLGKAAVFA